MVSLVTMAMARVGMAGQCDVKYILEDVASGETSSVLKNRFLEEIQAYTVQTKTRGYTQIRTHSEY